MELDSKRALQRVCMYPGCTEVVRAESVPEMIEKVHMHIAELHPEWNWPNWLDLNAYDKRFLQGTNISIE